MNTDPTEKHLGLTKLEWEATYSYNKEEGNIYSKSSCKVIGSPSPYGLLVKKRLGDKVMTINLGRLCMFLLTEEDLPRHTFVRYYDEDINNLRPENLYLSKSKSVFDFRYLGREEIVDIDTGIIYNPNSNMFVVKRGSKQSVYRTYSLEEAISIRKEWELDNSIHKWDKSCEKVRKQYGVD